MYNIWKPKNTEEAEEMAMNQLLELLERDCSLTKDQLAASADMSVEQVGAAIKQYEADRVILGYQAIIDWDQVRPEAVTALIEVNVTPQSIDGFDRIAERIYQYDEVESMYLMSGSFDLTVIISGRTLREVAQFVGERLAPIQGVTGTATHFILKKYKEKHLVFRPKDPEEREFLFV
jgi:DNA-binding Lrp family transcriptional regulator